MDLPATLSNASDSNEYPGATPAFDIAQDNNKRRRFVNYPIFRFTRIPL